MEDSFSQYTIIYCWLSYFLECAPMKFGIGKSDHDQLVFAQLASTFALYICYLYTHSIPLKKEALHRFPVYTTYLSGHSC